jgi:predicted polyphosphate/ATP-dependent NAD kinase
MKRLGLIVNPIAGLGGRVGLKGTDGAAAKALALGAVPEAGSKARRALRMVPGTFVPGTVLTAAGGMGEHACESLSASIVYRPPGEATTANDTRAAALAMEAAGADLIVFSGGDGTARDILDCLGQRLPLLGIPSGVKMHSAVFATSPEAAGQLVALLLTGEPGRVRFVEREVMDVDEEGLRQGRLSARLHGYARVPEERRLVQAAKAGGVLSEDAALDGAAHRIASEMEPGALHLIGPGTSAKRVLTALGLAGTLLGVDAVIDGALAGRDVSEAEILKLAAGRSIRIIVGVTGGQGFVLGRGNQQISPPIIRRAELTIIASVAKLVALQGGPLRVDTGDPDLDRALGGYARVVTGPGETMVMRIR